MKARTTVTQYLDGIRAWRDRIRAADVAAGGRRCRVCGCTDHASCSPLCAWVEIDLCSECA